MKAFLISIILFLTVGESCNKIQFTITIAHIKSTKGNIVVAIYTNQKEFKEDKPFKRLMFLKKNNIKNEGFKCAIELPEGKYGIAIHDDENADGKMNYNLFGIPKEGYGFSKFYHSGFTRPKYSDFEFTLKKNTNNLNIKLRYN